MWDDDEVLTIKIRSRGNWFGCEVYDVLDGEPHSWFTTTDDVLSWLRERLVPALSSSPRPPSMSGAASR